MNYIKIIGPGTKAVFAFITGSSLLFSSCATIFHGPRTSVKLEYEGNTMVTVDGNKLEPNAHTVKVRSKKSHTVVMSREGYKAITYDIKPSRKSISLLDIPVGILASIPFYMNIGDNRDGGQGTRAVTAFGVMMLAPIALLVIDACTGSNFKSYPRELHFIPVKLPPVNTAASQYPIGCTDVNLRIKIGDKIGSVNRKGERVSDIHWENTVNVKVEELEVIVNNGLKDLGFSVPKEIGGHGFTINAEVSGINITKNMVGWNYTVNCKLVTKWTVKDVFTDEIVKTEVIESLNTERSQNMNTVFFSAFENSFLSFLANNQKIYEVVSKQVQKPGVSNFDEIVLPVPKTDEKETVSDFIKSVVTIEGAENSHGSGFLISEDGYILTNYHVVKNSKQVNVILNGGLSFIGEVVRTEPNVDIALIKLGGKGFKALKLAEKSNEAAIGADVYAIGTPADKNLSQTVTKGIISGNRLMNDMAYIQSDVSVSPGSSGGPLLNKNGMVLGMITSKLINKGIEGISFALPSTKILEVMKLKYITP